MGKKTTKPSISPVTYNPQLAVSKPWVLTGGKLCLLARAIYMIFAFCENKLKKNKTKYTDRNAFEYTLMMTIAIGYG